MNIQHIYVYKYMDLPDKEEKHDVKTKFSGIHIYTGCLKIDATY